MFVLSLKATKVIWSSKCKLSILLVVPLYNNLIIQRTDLILTECRKIFDVPTGCLNLRYFTRYKRSPSICWIQYKYIKEKYALIICVIGFYNLINKTALNKSKQAVIVCHFKRHRKMDHVVQTHLKRLHYCFNFTNCYYTCYYKIVKAKNPDIWFGHIPLQLIFIIYYVSNMPRR